MSDASKAASELAKKRWAKTTPEERKEISKRMNAIKNEKFALRKLSRGEGKKPRKSQKQKFQSITRQDIVKKIEEEIKQGDKSVDEIIKENFHLLQKFPEEAISVKLKNGEEVCYMLKDKKIMKGLNL